MEFTWNCAGSEAEVDDEASGAAEADSTAAELPEAVPFAPSIFLV